MAQKKQREHDYAKLLYTTQNLTLKEVAERVEVTEKTVGKWCAEGLWDSLKKSLLTSKSDQLRRLYEIVDATTSKIESSEDGYGDTKLADIMVKYTAAIKNLETETNTGQMFETGVKFIRFVFKDNLELAQQITEYFDAFIQSELNNGF